MIQQFVRFKFKNAAGAFQSFTFNGATVSELFFSDHEIASVKITEPLKSEQSVTVGGYAAQVITKIGRSASFTIKFGAEDGAKTVGKLDLLYALTQVDKWTVQLQISNGNFNYGANTLTPTTYTFDCLLDYTNNWREPAFARGLKVTETEFIARETAEFALPNIQDVIATAPTGGGGN